MTASTSKRPCFYFAMALRQLNSHNRVGYMDKSGIIFLTFKFTKLKFLFNEVLNFSFTGLSALAHYSQSFILVIYIGLLTPRREMARSSWKGSCP